MDGHGSFAAPAGRARHRISSLNQSITTSLVRSIRSTSSLPSCVRGGDSSDDKDREHDEVDSADIFINFHGRRCSRAQRSSVFRASASPAIKVSELNQSGLKMKRMAILTVLTFCFCLLNGNKWWGRGRLIGLFVKKGLPVQIFFDDSSEISHGRN